MVSERSTSEQRGPSVLAKPIRPTPFSGSYRAASAENKHVHAPWVFNNNPQVLDNSSKNHRNAQRSSIASLSSSSALSIDERFNGGLNIKSFEKFAHMGQPHVIALYNFETGVDGDLEFEVGDIIMLEDIVDESWYKGRSIRTGAVGIFPMNHVEVRIPLTSGLFTNTQPKMQFVYSNRSNNFTNTTRTYSHPSFRKKPVPLPKIINQSAPNNIHPNYTLCSQKLPTCYLPKRPSKIRVASLKAKHEGSSSNSTDSLNSQTTSSLLNYKSPTNNLTNTEYKVCSTPLSTSLPINNLLPNRLQVSTKPFSHSTVKSPNTLQTKSQLAPNPTPLLPPPSPPTSIDQLQEQQQIPKTCNAPPVINSLKPRNQTAISQIAQMLQEKGIVSYRSRQMPSGAKHLYPGSHPLLISSAPSSSERLKSFAQMNNIHDNNNNITRNCTDNNNLNVNTKIQDETTNNTNNGKRKEEGEEEQTLVKTTKYHSPLLVETVLSKLLPELNRSPSRSSDLNNLNKTSNNKHTLNPRMANSKRLDTDKNHSTENSYSTDNTNDIVTNTTNNNISNASNYLKHLNESNMHNGIESDHGDQSTDVKSITIVKNAKLFRNNSSVTSKNNIDYNSHLRRAYTVIKPPEKLITSKAYISLSSSGKSSNNNQISKTMTEETTTNTRYDQQSPRSESNYQYSLMDSTGESNHSKLITTNDWLIVEHEQLGNESTGELHLTVGDILKCIDSSPQVCDRRNDSHLQYSISSSSSRKWIKCENWFGVIGLVNISSVRVIDDSNELAYYLEARPRVKALYTFDKETDDDLALSPGDIVYLFEAIDENWYRGESATTGNRGMFPATFVEVIKPL
ncbi:unnamed protein product [Schistosoma margrebowiei]|uniref:Uncharacterized protein n=1 Tax=Schistosoma margrebowiei TaxID=48269 RepID=A0A183LBD3_9TREM|nr:unnamed protein product [Schistosoma margrebowiei]